MLVVYKALTKQVFIGERMPERAFGQQSVSKQWGKVAKTATSGYAEFALPITFGTVYTVVPTIYSGVNSDGQLGWNGIGTVSTTKVNVTWNTYEHRSPVAYVGYIAVGKA